MARQEGLLPVVSKKSSCGTPAEVRAGVTSVRTGNAVRSELGGNESRRHWTARPGLPPLGREQRAEM